jgi:hypothetical protein
MKAAAPAFLAVLSLVGGNVCAQAANDPLPQLHGCALTDRANRPECLDKSSAAAAPPFRVAAADGGWVVSETTSPVDYSPIATATTASRKGAGTTPPMQLTIRCRGGRTELALTGPAITGHGDNYFISYRVNGGQSLQLAGAEAAFGDGVAFKGDVVSLLQQLPADGEFAVRLLTLAGNELDALFSLNGLDALRTRIGATCKWPHAMAKPNDR